MHLAILAANQLQVCQRTCYRTLLPDISQLCPFRDSNQRGDCPLWPVPCGPRDCTAERSAMKSTLHQDDDRWNGRVRFHCVRNTSEQRMANLINQPYLLTLSSIYIMYRLCIPCEIMVRNNLKCCLTNPTIQVGDVARSCEAHSSFSWPLRITRRAFLCILS